MHVYMTLWENTKLPRVTLQPAPEMRNSAHVSQCHQRDFTNEDNAQQISGHASVTHSPPEHMHWPESTEQMECFSHPVRDTTPT